MTESSSLQIVDGVWRAITLVCSVAIWRLAYLRGWRRMLPMFTFCIAFLCITGFFLGFLRYLQFVNKLATSACVAYLYGWNISGAIAPAFEMAAVSELHGNMLHRQPNMQHKKLGWLFLSWGMFVVGGTLMAAPEIFATQYGLPVTLMRATANSGLLWLGGQILFVYLIKQKRSLSMGRTPALIIGGMAILCAVELILMFPALHTHLAWSRNLAMVADFAFLLCWLLAVLKRPEPTAQGALAVANSS